MRKIKITFARKRYLVLPLLVVCAVIFGDAYASSWLPLQQRIEAAKNRIEHVQWLVDHYEQLKQQYQKNPEKNDLISTFVLGATPEEATTHLQQHLKELIDSSRANIITAQPLPVKDESGTPVVSARYQITVTPSSLTQFLYQVENSQPLIFIDTADIAAQPRAVGLTDLTQASTPNLSLQIDLHAYARIGQHAP